MRSAAARLLRASFLVLAGVTLPETIQGAAVPVTTLAAVAPTVPRSMQGGARNSIPRCPSGKVENYLDAAWQQCWFDAAHGRWRTLNHELHYYTVIVEVEATSLADAEEIARRFAALHADRFEEITVYVQAESAPATSPIRRVEWSRDTKTFESLDFVGSLNR
jgi:hypothetical protein